MCTVSIIGGSCEQRHEFYIVTIGLLHCGSAQPLGNCFVTYPGSVVSFAANVMFYLSHRICASLSERQASTLRLVH
jgi:hypothetical protein